MQPEAISRYSHCKEGTAVTGPSRERLLLSGISGPRLARPPFKFFSPSPTLWSDFSVWSVLAWACPATYVSAFLLLAFGCVGVSPVGSTWSRLRDPPLTGDWRDGGVAPCFLCSFTFCFDCPFFVALCCQSPASASQSSSKSYSSSPASGLDFDSRWGKAITFRHCPSGTRPQPPGGGGGGSKVDAQWHAA